MSPVRLGQVRQLLGFDGVRVREAVTVTGEDLDRGN
jgi:hypothetical protein